MNMETLQTTTRSIPAASPYYDRLRSLHIELDFAPYGSPEREHLLRQVSEMERRAHERMEMMQRLK